MTKYRYDNGELIEVKKGLQFQLREGADRTIFTIHDIVGDMVIVSWPGEERTAEYEMKDVLFRLKFGDWVAIPILPAQPEQKEEQTYNLTLSQLQELWNAGYLHYHYERFLKVPSDNYPDMKQYFLEHFNITLP